MLISGFQDLFFSLRVWAVAVSSGSFELSDRLLTFMQDFRGDGFLRDSAFFK